MSKKKIGVSKGERDKQLLGHGLRKDLGGFFVFFFL
jgi:hypothetical protein